MKRELAFLATKQECCRVASYELGSELPLNFRHTQYSRQQCVCTNKVLSKTLWCSPRFCELLISWRNSLTSILFNQLFKFLFLLNQILVTSCREIVLLKNFFQASS